MGGTGGVLSHQGLTGRRGRVVLQPPTPPHQKKKIGATRVFWGSKRNLGKISFNAQIVGWLEQSFLGKWLTPHPRFYIWQKVASMPMYINILTWLLGQTSIFGGVFFVSKSLLEGWVGEALSNRNRSVPPNMLFYPKRHDKQPGHFIWDFKPGNFLNLAK